MILAWECGVGDWAACLSIVGLSFYGAVVNDNLTFFVTTVGNSGGRRILRIDVWVADYNGELLLV